MAERGPGRPAGSAGRQGREAILKAARELLAEEGTSRVTLRQVAQRAGVQAPLVNYYFGSKAELFEAVIENVAEALGERMQAIVDRGGSAQDRLRAFLAGVVRALAEDPFAPRLMVELILFPDDARTDRFMRDFIGPNVAVLQGLLREGAESGDFAEIDPRMLGPAMMGTCIFYFLGAPGFRRMFEFEPLDPDPVDRYAAFVGELILHGISKNNTGAD